jgi:hypothetical protein
MMIKSIEKQIKQGFILKGNGDGSARLERSSYYQEFL